MFNKKLQLSIFTRNMGIASSAEEWNAVIHGNVMDEYMNRTFTTGERAVRLVPEMDVEFKSDVRVTSQHMKQRQVLTRIMLCYVELEYGGVIIKNYSRNTFLVFKFVKLWRNPNGEPILEAQFGVSPDIQSAKAVFRKEETIQIIECSDEVTRLVEQYVKKYSKVMELINVMAGLQLYDSFIPPMPPKVQ